MIQVAIVYLTSGGFYWVAARQHEPINLLQQVVADIIRQINFRFK